MLITYSLCRLFVCSHLAIFPQPQATLAAVHPPLNVDPGPGPGPGPAPDFDCDCSSWIRLLVSCHNSQHLTCFSCPNCQSCQLVYCISVCHISQSDVGAIFRENANGNGQGNGAWRSGSGRQNTWMDDDELTTPPTFLKVFIDVDEVVAAALPLWLLHFIETVK